MIPLDAFRRVVAPALMLSLVAMSAAEDPALIRIRTAVEAARKKYNVPGMSLAIVKDGKVVFADGFGLRDVQRRLPATANTVYAIGSSTKSFTSLLTTEAASEGKLAITDPPSKYLPEFRLKDPETNAKITLSDMMSHRSGLPRTDLAWYSNAFSRDDLLHLIAGVDPTAKLGEKWQYQNLMFLFTGMIDEKVYGKPYETLIQERFFDPLGMTNSTATYAGFMAMPERAIGYLPAGEKTSESPLPVHNIDVCAPAGSIASSVTDMAKYLQMLLADGQYEGKTVFAKDAIAETRKRRMAMAPGSPMGYGFGWMLRPFEGRTLIEHGGNIDGFNAEVALLPNEHLGAVVLTNVSAGPLALEAAQIALKELLPPPAAPAVDATKKPEAKAAVAAVKLTKADETPVSMLGEYRLEMAKVDLRFFREKETTYVEQSGQRIPLTLIGPGRYQAPTGPRAIFTFAPDPKDPKNVIATFEVPGTKLPLTRALPYQVPMTAEALLAKAVEARGGEANLRRHATTVVHFQGRMLSDGIDVAGIRYSEGIKAADFQVLYGLGRRFGQTQSFSDGTSTGDYTTFTPSSLKTGPEAAEGILASNELADLEPSRWYKSLTVVREEKVNGEDAYVLKKQPLLGNKPIFDYISKTTFRRLRQDVGNGPTDPTVIYSDFREVDGLTLPFKTVSYAGDSGKTVIEITKVEFDQRVPDWVFKLPSK